MAETRQTHRRNFLLQAGAMAAAVVCRPTQAAEAPARPPFSWDRVPVYGHLGKNDDDFTQQELEFLARRFDFLTVEKGQAVRKRGSTEAGIYEAARQLKRLNPRMCVLFYWNTFLNYPLYGALEKFPATGQLKDQKGQPLLKDGRIPRPDLSQAEVRQWWSDVAAQAQREAPLDGIFADALPQVLTPALRRQVGEQKALALANGLREMLALTKQKMGPGKLLLVNGLRGAEQRELLDWEGVDGVIIEHFGAFRSGSPADMKADLDSLALTAARGKFAVLKAWPDFTWLDTQLMARPHEELLKLARERITFPLACFLIAAQPGAYFCYSWGYRESHGMLDVYPELDQPLGPPRGPAVWTGLTARRQFAHAAVSVDLPRRQARIDWK